VDLAALDFRILAPIGFVAVGALMVLLGEVWVVPRNAGDAAEARRKASVVLVLVSSFALSLALYATAVTFVSGQASVFNPAHPMLRVDAFSSLASALVVLCALLSLWSSITYLPALRIDHGEYYALLLLSVVGAFAMVAAVDMLALFVGLELLSVPVYVLAGFDRRRLRSNESGLKYYLTGAFASALAVYGIALLYGATGSTGYAGIRAGFDASDPIAMSGLALVISGFAFKIASVPFHQWAPDVYEGAPTPVAAYLSTAVKVAAFAALVRLLVLALPEITPELRRVFTWLALLSMVVGNGMAIVQTNLKRLLAYSSVAHSGYMLIGLAVASDEALASLFFYLGAYVFANLGAFGLVASLARRGEEYERIDDFAGMAAHRPGLALLMTLFMLSLAGIPATAGFAAKFQIFRAAVDADGIALAIVGVLASLVSLFYYLRVPVAMYFQEAGEREPGEPDLFAAFTLVLCAFAILYLGFVWERGPLPLVPSARAAVAALLP